MKTRQRVLIVLVALIGSVIYYFARTRAAEFMEHEPVSTSNAVQKSGSTPPGDRRFVASGTNLKTASAGQTTPDSPVGTSEVIFTAPWGDGPGQLGHALPTEGAPEGPMSFVVDKAGRYRVLDQINSRIQVFETGKPSSSIPLSRNTYQDLVLDAAGNHLLLDRLARASITRLDPDGAPLGEIDLVGPGIPEGGGITGMFSREDGIWIEVEHSRLVRVADADGAPDPNRPIVKGRFSPDGNWLLTAALERPQGATVFRQASALDETAPELLARVRFSDRVSHLLTLAADATDRVFVAAHLVTLREVAPFDVLSSRDEVVILAQDGTEQRRLSLPTPRRAEEQFRSISVGPDGTIHQLLLDENGATMRRWI